MPSILRLNNLSGREGDFGKIADRTIRRQWLALTDTRYYSEGALLADAIAFGSTPPVPTPYLDSHPDLSAFLCKRLRARQERKSPLHWIIEAEYDTKPFDQNQDQTPLNRDAEITWSTIKYQKAVERDINGNGIVNSAGIAFNPPPLKDLSRWTCSVAKNVSSVPTNVLTYRDKLNSGTFTIDGISVAAKVAKIQSIQISKWKVEGEEWYRTFACTLEFDDIDKWKGKYLQQGIVQKSGSDRIPCVDKHGQPVRFPVPLTAAGAQLSDPTTTNVVFTDYDIYESMDFSALPLS